MIEVGCVCGNKIKVQDEHAGLSIKCPKCRKLVAVAHPADVAIPPPGLAAADTIPETLPPPGIAPETVAVALAGRQNGPLSPAGAPTPADPLLRAVERLIDVCQGIRILLAAILGVAVVQWLLSFFRR